MNREELEKLKELINEYCNKYHCKLELEEMFCGYYNLEDMYPKYNYRLIATREKKIIC